MTSFDELHHFINHSFILSPHTDKDHQTLSSSPSFSCSGYSKTSSCYKFIKNLQLGSYGKVILANDLSTNLPVAIKVMPKPSGHSSFMARHELSILKKLHFKPHQNICQLLDFFQTENYHWFVFEYCSNGDLYDYIANKENDSRPLHFKTLVKELVQVINYSHSKGIYHRDIKPENILIDSSKSIKLTDWGLATLTIISEDPCVGTEKYMAPETFFKSNKRSAKSNSYNTKLADYWSLGITLLYVLFKRCPWKLANSSDPNFKAFTQDPFILFDWYPRLSKFGFDCILSLLQLNPSHRNLDRFYEKAIINGYKESFVMEDIFSHKSIAASFAPETNEISEPFDMDEEDDMLFGMDIDDSTSLVPITEKIPEINIEDGDHHNDSFTDDIFEAAGADDTSSSYYDDILTPMTQSLQTPKDSSDIGLKMRTLCIGGVNPGDKKHHHLQQPELHNSNNLFLAPFIGDDTRSQFGKLDTLGW